MAEPTILVYSNYKEFGSLKEFQAFLGVELKSETDSSSLKLEQFLSENSFEKGNPRVWRVGGAGSMAGHYNSLIRLLHGAYDQQYDQNHIRNNLFFVVGERKPAEEIICKLTELYLPLGFKTDFPSGLNPFF